MTVAFSVASVWVQFDTTADWFACVDRDRCIGEIRSSFMVPDASLHDLDAATISTRELPAEFAGEPSCLQFVFAHPPRHPEQMLLV